MRRRTCKVCWLWSWKSCDSWYHFFSLRLSYPIIADKATKNCKDAANRWTENIEIMRQFFKEHNSAFNDEEVRRFFLSFKLLVSSASLISLIFFQFYQRFDLPADFQPLDWKYQWKNCCFLNAALVCAVNSRGAIKQSQKLRKQLVFPALQVPTKITASQIVNLNTEKKYLNALASNPNLFMNNLKEMQ